MANVVNHNDGAVYALFLNPDEVNALAGVLNLVSVQGSIGKQTFEIVKALYHAGIVGEHYRFEDVSSEDEYLIRVEEWEDREH